MRWYGLLEEAGPYHNPKYLEMLAGEFEYDSEYAELFIYGDETEFIYYPYVRRPLSDLSFADDALKDPESFSDIVSSWYYGGPLLSDAADESIVTEFVKAFSSYCKREGIVGEFIRFDPNLQNHADFGVLDPQYNRQTVPVDLTQSKDEVWEGYEDRNKRAIKQARRSKLTIDREPNKEDIVGFHGIYSNAMEARDADEHYRFPLNYFQRLLDSSLFSLIVARYEDNLVGGFIIAHDENIGHHYLSASNPDYWDYRVNNLMYHDAVMYMQETGRNIFDFQGGRPGVFNFKKGFSPDRRDFHIASRVHRPDTYDTLVETAFRNGIDTESGYFPAYRPEQSN